MEHISKHLPATSSLLGSENTANPELTDEEREQAIASAITYARQQKADRLAREEKERRRAEWEADIRRPWTSEELFRFIEYRATNEYRLQFVVDDANMSIVKMLCRYFTGDARFEKMGEGFSLDKGLLLAGNVGTGKSTLMQLFGRNKRQCYNMISCRKISALYAEDGHGIFETYRGPRHEPMNDGKLFFQRQIGYCFDDLGTEETKKHYGNEVNVMSEILLNRYDEKHRYPWTQTHITTNLTFQQIEEGYGTRVRSRIREMFNIIELDGSDRRR